jgi:hypothetical protein
MMAGPNPFYRALGPLSVSTGLVADRLQFGDAVLQNHVRKIGDAIFDGVIEPLQVCLSRPHAQFGDMRRLALGSLLAAVENRGQNFFKPPR